VKRVLDRLFFDHWKAIDSEHLPGKGQRVDYKPLVILVTVAVSLTMQSYWGERPEFVRLFPPAEAKWTGDYYNLWQFAWWTGWRFGGYVILPIAVILAMPGERLRDYFVGFGSLEQHAWIYAVLLLMVAPLVYFASTRESFYHTYPFYKWSNRSWFDFCAWQAMYVLQFVSLEFFFRGFMLKGLEKSFGAGAVFVMIVPYCMIHYGKPMPETIGAIGAGIILGTLAMRSRSIWGGVVVHCAVAISMDLLALQHCPGMGSGLPCPSH